jgi:hypothetical protein
MPMCRSRDFSAYGLEMTLELSSYEKSYNCFEQSRRIR